MANVKVLDKRTDKRTAQKLFAPDLSMRNHKMILMTDGLPELKKKDD